MHASARAGEPPETAGPTVPEIAGGERAATILLVEDDALVRGVVRSMLERLGYAVLEAEAPHAALGLAAGGAAFDLVLTDMVMPGMNGYELAQELADVRPGIPVVYTSGYPGDGIQARGILHAQRGFIQKPFTTATLAAAVEAALSGS